MIWGCGADLTKSRVHYLGYSLFFPYNTQEVDIIRMIKEEDQDIIYDYKLDDVSMGYGSYYIDGENEHVIIEEDIEIFVKAVNE